jgi:hypothetical protein
MLPLCEANALTDFCKGMSERNASLARADNQNIEAGAFIHKKLACPMNFSLSLRCP